MKLKSMDLIYKTVNAIASRKFDRETEQSLVNELERELLVANPHVLLDQQTEIGSPFPQAQAGAAAM